MSKNPKTCEGKNSPLNPCIIKKLTMIYDDLKEDVKRADAKRKQQKKEAQRRWSSQNKRVYISMSYEDYADLEKIARKNGRTVAQQVYAQSKAYQKNEFLPSKSLEAKINAFGVTFNRIGTNINQIAFHSNYFNRFFQEKNFLEEFSQLQIAVEGFLNRPWKNSQGNNRPKNP